MTRLLSYFSIPVSTRLPSTVKQIKENYTVIVHWPVRLQWTKEPPVFMFIQHDTFFVYDVTTEQGSHKSWLTVDEVYNNLMKAESS